MAAPQSPLVGYNTNVRHHGKLYHIQTEDSGVNHPHVITHLFADGGRIIASRKTSYAEHVGAEELSTIVRKLMQEQHKAIFIELRDCVYDEDDGSAAPGADAVSDAPMPPADASPEVPADVGTDSATELLSPPDPQVDALEKAAAEKAAGSAAAKATGATYRGAGKYHHTVAAHPGAEPPVAVQGSSSSIFGGQLVQGKSLDEVILSYLADDIEDS